MEAFAASVRSGLLDDESISDDRFLCDVERGLFLVCDASGPTYGGYYAPFGVDPGIAALVSTFDATAGTTRARLLAALQAAHAKMCAMNDAYERVRAGRHGLAVAKECADAVRPDIWKGRDTLAHFGASIAVCAVGPDAIAVARVGVCRVYALRDAPVSVFRDESIAAMNEAAGMAAEITEAHHCPSKMLGLFDLALEVIEEPRAPIVLCTDGTWSASRAIAQLFDARSTDDVRGIVDTARTETRDDATAVVLR